MDVEVVGEEATELLLVDLSEFSSGVDVAIHQRDAERPALDVQGKKVAGLRIRDPPRRPDQGRVPEFRGRQLATADQRERHDRGPREDGLQRCGAPQVLPTCGRARHPLGEHVPLQHLEQRPHFGPGLPHEQAAPSDALVHRVVVDPRVASLLAHLTDEQGERRASLAYQAAEYRRMQGSVHLDLVDHRSSWAVLRI